VTAQIKTFEDQCDLKLFKKKGRSLYLSEEGSTLYEYARRIFEYEREVEDVIEEMRKLKRGTLRLGRAKLTLATSCRSSSPVFTKPFHKSKSTLTKGAL